MSDKSLLSCLALVIVSVSACTDFVLMPPHEPTMVAPCKAPPVIQNVVSTWRWGIRDRQSNDTIPRNAPFTTATFDRMGVVSFDSNGRVKDPDFIWGKTFSGDGQLVQYLTYKWDETRNPYDPFPDDGPFKVITYGKTFDGYVAAREIYSYSVLANECNYIYLYTKGGGRQIVLRR